MWQMLGGGGGGGGVFASHLWPALKEAHPDRDKGTAMQTM